MKNASPEILQLNFYFENGILFLILVISALISARTFFSVALLWGILFMLNEAPLRLGKIPVLCSLLNAIALLSVALIGFTTFGGPMIGFPPKWILIILGVGFVVGVINENINPAKRQWFLLCLIPLSFFLLYSVVT